MSAIADFSNANKWLDCKWCCAGSNSSQGVWHSEICFAILMLRFKLFFVFCYRFYLLEWRSYEGKGIMQILVWMYLSVLQWCAIQETDTTMPP